eukprot:2491701-Amphidinium_carterae.1
MASRVRHNEVGYQLCECTVLEIIGKLRVLPLPCRKNRGLDGEIASQYSCCVLDLREFILGYGGVLQENIPFLTPTANNTAKGKKFG